MTNLDFSPDKGQDERIIAKLMRSKAFKLLLALVVVSIIVQLVMSVRELISSGSTKVLSDGQVTVRQKAMHVDIKYLDRADWPISRRFGDAFTTWSFITKMDWDLKPVPHTRPPQFILEKMSIDLNLPIMIFLPYGVPEKLHDHEMGHLKICQKVYDEAAQSALDYGKRMIGQTFVARVGYAADAKQTVIREAHVDFDQQFRKQSEDETDKISDFYDQITHHGLNNVNPDQGVTMALQKYAQWRANGGTDGQQPPQIKGPSAAQDSVKINSDDKAVKKDRQKSK